MERVGRLGLVARRVETGLEPRGRGREGGGFGFLLRRGERAAGEFPAGERHRRGVGLARDHGLERLLGLGPLAVLRLADGEVVAALERERILGMGGEQRLPLLGGEVPRLAVVQGGRGRVGRAGRVARRGLLGRRERGEARGDERRTGHAVG